MKIEYDTESDTLTIEGEKYAGACFRFLANVGKPREDWVTPFGKSGDLFAVERGPDGKLWFRHYPSFPVN